VYA
jgi:hypothetical protein